MKNSKLITLFFSLITFLFPLFFLPFTVEFYDFNKNYLIWVGITIGFFLWAIKCWKEEKIEIKISGWLVLLFLWVISWMTATIFASPNKVEALILPRGTGSLLGLLLFYFLLLNLVEKREKIFWSLITSGGILALLTIYQFFGLGEALIPSQSPLAFMRGKNWTPGGNLLITGSFLVALLPAILASLMNSLKNQQKTRGVLQLLILLLFVGASAIIVYQLLPGKPTSLTLLPFSSGWAIAVESFKQNPLFGVGPLNFISAFNRFRPLSFNNYNFWNLRFGYSSNFLLEVWTELGIFGLAVLGVLIARLLKNFKNLKNFPEFLGVLMVVLIWLFLPGNLLLLFCFFVLLALISPSKIKFTLAIKNNLRWLPVGLVILIFLPVWWLAGRAYAAEVYFKKSLDALSKNDGLDTYNNQIKAIRLNRYRTDFRLAYSQTNWALANSIASNPPTGQLTDQDRNNIAQLIQQAINEAKIATSLYPNNAIVWENLAQIYRNLINLAQGADQWALASYQQAIATDPINPRLRIDLGGLFYALRNYDEAQKIFRTAVELKPDYANGWYNLAAAYREEQKYSQAYQAMQQTLALVPIDSEDWKKAKEELDELAKKLPTPTPTLTGQTQPTPTPKEEGLKSPPPLPSPAIKPPLELPQEAKPEVPPETPAP